MNNQPTTQNAEYWNIHHCNTVPTKKTKLHQYKKILKISLLFLFFMALKKADYLLLYLWCCSCFVDVYVVVVGASSALLFNNNNNNNNNNVYVVVVGESLLVGGSSSLLIKGCCCFSSPLTHNFPVQVARLQHSYIFNRCVMFSDVWKESNF